MANPFPANFETLAGSRRLTGQVDFTDATNQPGAGVAVKTTALTNAQVKALPTTGITILAAQGASTIIVPLHATLRLAWTADYTNIDATATLFLGWGTNVAAAAIDQADGNAVSSLLAGGGPDGTSALMPAIGRSAAGAGAAYLNGADGYFDSDISNVAVALNATNGAASNFTGGNAANALTVTLLYYIVSF